MLSLSLMHHHPGSGSVADPTYVSCAVVFGSPLTLATFVLAAVIGCTFQFMALVFLYFLQNFPKFRG